MAPKLTLTLVPGFLDILFNSCLTGFESRILTIATILYPGFTNAHENVSNRSKPPSTCLPDALVVQLSACHAFRGELALGTEFLLYQVEISL